jgi:hypothetical protein
MKNALLLSFLLQAIIFRLSAQSILDDRVGISYFESGTELLKNGDFKASDSLLTLALCSYKNENVYINRGIARLYYNDTIGFCEDFQIAAYKYLDLDASRLYNSLCCIKVDTIYYDKNYIPVTNSKFKYYEVVTQEKYREKTIGIIHQKGAKLEKIVLDYGCNNYLSGLGFLTTDIIAVYELVDTLKYYSKTTKSIKIFNLSSYQNVKENAGNDILKKYGKINPVLKTDKHSVFFMIVFSNSGEILEIEFLGIFPFVDMEDYKEELAKDILLHVKKYPKISPASFMKEKVYYKTIDSFTL